MSASADLVEFNHELFSRFQSFYVDRWCPIRHPFDPNEEGSEARAIELVKANILDVFKNDFAPFAFDVATHAGLHRFPEGLPNPPPIPDAAPSKNVSNDLILLPKDLTGTDSARDAGFLIIAWGAIYHDPQQWDKIRSYHSVIERWVQDGLVCRWEPEHDGRLVRRTYNQPFEDMVKPALKKLLKERTWNPAVSLGHGLTKPSVAGPQFKLPVSEGDERKGPPLAARKAYLSFELAEAKLERRLKDREAYDYLDKVFDWGEASELGDLTDYNRPAFDTWARHLRTARQALSEQKHNKRFGRSHRRSIAKSREVDSFGD